MHKANKGGVKIASEKRLIDANPIENGIGVYVATNAYLNDTALDALGKVAKWLDEAPTVDAVEVVHGRWSEAEDGDGAVCSVCGEDFCNVYLEVERFNYCPNCGAKMDLEVT